MVEVDRSVRDLRLVERRHRLGNRLDRLVADLSLLLDHLVEELARWSRRHDERVSGRSGIPGGDHARGPPRGHGGGLQGEVALVLELLGTRQRERS